MARPVVEAGHVARRPAERSVAGVEAFDPDPDPMTNERHLAPCLALDPDVERPRERHVADPGGELLGIAGLREIVATLPEARRDLTLEGDPGRAVEDPVIAVILGA